MDHLNSEKIGEGALKHQGRLRRLLNATETGMPAMKGMRVLHWKTAWPFIIKDKPSVI